MSRNISIDNTFKLKVNKEFLLDLYFIMLLTNEMLRIIFGGILGYVDLSSGLSIITGIITYIPLFLYFVIRPEFKKSIYPFILLFFFIGCFFGGTYLIHPSYAEWFSRETYGVWDSIFRPDQGSIYIFLAVALVGNIDRIRSDLYAVGWINFFTCGYQILRALSRGYWEAYNRNGEIINISYNVDFGYNAAVVAVTFLYFCIQTDKKWKKTLYAAVFTVTSLWIVFYGSRGALVALGVALVLTIGYFFRSLSGIKQIFVWIALIIGTTLLSFAYEMILSGLIAFLTKYNIDTRSITMFIQGSFMDENGRNDINQLAVDLIHKQGIFGSGAFGDRPVIGPSFYWGYCHSIFLEMIIDFGIIIGVIVIAFLLWKCIQYYVRCKDWNQIGIFIIVFSACMKLVFSDSFWNYQFFWFLIALLYYTMPQRKTRIRF